MENHMLVFAVVMSFISTLYGETKPKVGIGVILDTETSLGKMSRSCISMALGDFYKKHDNYTTRIVPHFRDSKQDNVEAASVAIDIGSKSSVPIISPATSPSLTPNDKPYFIRSSHDSSSQLKPIAELIKHFGWREVVFIYEDGDYGRGLFPYIADAMVNVDAKVMYRTVIYHSASDDWILKELYKMKTMQTRVFIVHALPDLATRFFKKVNEAGMMEEGYAWIITEVLTSRLHSLDHTDIDSMQGVLAIALEKVASGINFSTNFKRQPESMTDVDGIGISEMGPRLIPLIRNIKLNGLSGDFYLVDGQLQPSVYQIVNILDKGLKHVSYWTPTNGIRKKLHQMKGSKDDLGAIIWPARRGFAFAQFVDVNIDPKTRKVISVTGFCIDIFIAVMDALPYAVKIEFVPFALSGVTGTAEGYKESFHSFSNGAYGVVAGDLTILADRMDNFDFSLPYTEAGFSMVVPIKVDERKSTWIFMRPLETELWITIGAFFIYTGLVVWVVEHR
ncbi:glutamate receptor 2.8-like protein, partial [Tanacetum coccineum]